jgi:hypothetical protein
MGHVADKLDRVMITLKSGARIARRGVAFSHNAGGKERGYTLHVDDGMAILSEESTGARIGIIVGWIAGRGETKAMIEAAKARLDAIVKTHGAQKFNHVIDNAVATWPYLSHDATLRKRRRANGAVRVSRPASERAGMKLPKSDADWQSVVDAAEAFLALDSARQYGLIAVDVVVDVDRCLAILSEGKKRGFAPSKDAIERLVTELMEGK